MSVPSGAPTSGLCEIRDTPNAGRGVFATKFIPADTPLHQTEPPVAHLIQREYRREVCAQCFEYDRGREWKFRSQTGLVFCTEECQTQWQDLASPDEVAAWEAVEKLIRSRSSDLGELDDADAIKPTKAQIALAWQTAEKQADIIRAARLGSSTKQHKKRLRQVLAERPAPDTLSFLLSGVLFRYSKPQLWRQVLALASNPRPYRSLIDLNDNTRSYLHLLAILPQPLMPYAARDTFTILASRDSHNSFGIRSLDDGGSEYMGYGIWPSASYFNHSCDPNVFKERNGKCWRFWAGRDIEEGQELCITYQAGEEKASRGERREKLKKNWGFNCECERCEYKA